MFSHVHLGSNDADRAKRFYDALFKVIGGPEGVQMDDRHRYFYLHNGAIFIIGAPLDGEAATVGNGLTVGFHVESPEQGDAWHAAGLANGGTSVEDPPGIRERPGRGRIYLAYLRDPDGNKISAMKRLDS